MCSCFPSKMNVLPKPKRNTSSGKWIRFLTILAWTHLCMARSFSQSADNMEPSFDRLPDGPQTDDEKDKEAQQEESPDLFEGDLVIEQSVLNAIEQGETAKRDRIPSLVKLWDNGKVPYIFDNSLEEVRIKMMVKKAAELLENQTCISFVPRAHEEHFVTIKLGTNGCFSSLGKMSKLSEQVIELTKSCAYVGTILHEMMHTIGFFHEQSRLDRDHYVNINWNNIQKHRETQFRKYPHGDADFVAEPYDYDSVMHYPRNAFSANGLPTILPINAPWREIGRRDKMSDIDVRKINKLYSCDKIKKSSAETQPESSSNGTSSSGKDKNDKEGKDNSCDSSKDKTCKEKSKDSKEQEASKSKEKSKTADDENEKEKKKGKGSQSEINKGANKKGENDKMPYFKTAINKEETEPERHNNSASVNASSANVQDAITETSANSGEGTEGTGDRNKTSQSFGNETNVNNTSQKSISGAGQENGVALKESGNAQNTTQLSLSTAITTQNNKTSSELAASQTAPGLGRREAKQGAEAENLTLPLGTNNEYQIANGNNSRFTGDGKESRLTIGPKLVEIGEHSVGTNGITHEQQNMKSEGSPPLETIQNGNSLLRKDSPYLNGGTVLRNTDVDGGRKFASPTLAQGKALPNTIQGQMVGSFRETKSSTRETSGQHETDNFVPKIVNFGDRFHLKQGISQGHFRGVNQKVLNNNKLISNGPTSNQQGGKKAPRLLIGGSPSMRPQTLMTANFIQQSRETEDKTPELETSEKKWGQPTVIADASLIDARTNDHNHVAGSGIKAPVNCSALLQPCNTKIYNSSKGNPGTLGVVWTLGTSSDRTDIESVNKESTQDIVLDVNKGQVKKELKGAEDIKINLSNDFLDDANNKERRMSLESQKENGPGSSRTVKGFNDTMRKVLLSDPSAEVEKNDVQEDRDTMSGTYSDSVIPSLTTASEEAQADEKYKTKGVVSMSAKLKKFTGRLKEVVQESLVGSRPGNDSYLQIL